MDVDFDDIGDGICDENLNHEVCNYDGGDCCFGIKGVSCWMCQCKEESMLFPIITDAPLPSKLLFMILLIKITFRYFPTQSVKVMILKWEMGFVILKVTQKHVTMLNTKIVKVSYCSETPI